MPVFVDKFDAGFWESSVKGRKKIWNSSCYTIYSIDCCLERTYLLAEPYRVPVPRSCLLLPSATPHACERQPARCGHAQASWLEESKAKCRCVSLMDFAEDPWDQNRKY